MLVAVLAVATLVQCARRPSRIRLDVEGDSLRIRLTGMDAVYALRRTIRLPVVLVKGVASAPRRLVPETGLRLPGTSIPGVLRAGSYGTGSRRDFWLARRHDRVLVIELAAGAPYRRVVLEMTDPEEAAQRLRPLVGAYTGTFEDRLG